MDLDIRDLFIHAEGNFVSSIANGEPVLGLWSTLEDKFSRATAAGELSKDTLAVAHMVTSRVSIIAECLDSIQAKQEECTNQLRQDWESIFSGIHSIEIAPKPTVTSRRSHSPSSPSSSGCSFPYFIEPAYRWLLSNLHNPYPSSEVKHAIAVSSHCSVPSINSWFVNARRRMGWTALCREHFHNCRADTVDAAYRALVKEDSEDKLSSELVHAFMVMKVTAEGLYSSTFTKSALAGDLDAVVKDMTEEEKKLVKARKRDEAEVAKLLKKHEKEERRKQRAMERMKWKCGMASDRYPSRQRSRTSSPFSELEEFLIDESDEEHITPSVVVGQKRRSLSMDDHHSSTPEIRPLKRLRSSMVSSSSVSPEPELSLPSPASTAPNAADLSDEHTPACNTAMSSAVACVSPNAALPASRKRRLSDADASGLPKRPRGPNAGPRLHAVSDPLPKAAFASELGVDDWFRSNFDTLFALPPPVDAGELDHSTPLEVQLFSDYRMPQDLHKDTLINDSNEARATDLAEFDSLLQSIVEPGKDIVNSTTSTLPSYADIIPPSQLALPSPVSSSIDWTFFTTPESLTTSLNAILPSSYDSIQTDSQYLPGIELSMLQLPQLSPSQHLRPVTSMDPSPKQAKLDQLRAMQEAVRQMEREILQSGGL